MLKQKGFTVINITGLTIGISCSLLIALYVFDELRYDSFHADSNLIYRITYQSKIQDKKVHSAQTPALLSQGIRSMGEIEDATRIAIWKTFPIRYENKSFTEKYLVLADSSFFSFFSFNLIHGKAETVLKGPRKIVLTESAARRYFENRADSTVIGDTLLLAQGYTVQVSGIAQDPPPYSHFHFTHILSLDSWEELNQSSWLTPLVHTYIKIKPASDLSSLHKKLNLHLHHKTENELLATRQINYKTFSADGNSTEVHLQPLQTIHLHSALADEIEVNGNIRYIYLFMATAFFIALLACINFINLSTARSINRAKEVGIRKTVGASSGSLMKQFFLETYLFIILSAGLAYFVIALLLPFFNFLTDKRLHFSTLMSPMALTAVILSASVTGLLAGSYPALYLTQFSPIEVLRGKLRDQLRSIGIRNILVVFQFLVASALTVATVVVYLQLDYMQKMNMGFDKSDIIDLLHTKNLDEKGIAFKKELIRHNTIIYASYANRLPPQLDKTGTFTLTDSKKEYLMTVYEMDYDHLATLNIRMVKGRFFSKLQPSDTSAIIINEAAMKAFGWKDFSDKTIFSGYDAPHGRIRKVIGVIQDFNYQSAREPIQPLAVILGDEPSWEMAIRVKPGKADSALAFIQQTWKKYLPDVPFEARLLEKNLEDAYQTEQKIGMVFLTFTILAIFIACLGLFGLATFTAEQRTKEIGIRKVLGAGVFSITGMLNKNFLQYVVLGNVLSYPLIWWYMNHWLSQFEYHIPVSMWVFAFTTGISILIAFLSVSYQAIKAARTNPVNALRNE